jgi:hypothetical protein
MVVFWRSGERDCATTVQKSTTAVDLALLILGALMEDCSGARRPVPASRPKRPLWDRKGDDRRNVPQRARRADSGRSDGRGLMSQIDPNPTFTLRNPDEDRLVLKSRPSLSLPIQQAPVRWPSRLSSGERRNRRLQRGCG